MKLWCNRCARLRAHRLDAGRPVCCTCRPAPAPRAAHPLPAVKGQVQADDLYQLRASLRPWMCGCGDQFTAIDDASRHAFETDHVVSKGAAWIGGPA